MNQKDIENLINLNIKRIKDEYELLNITMLNALHRNIDIMIENSEKWFGKDIPREFRDVLSSLMTLTYLYCQEKAELTSSATEINYEEFKPDVFINSLIIDMESVLGLKNVLVDLELSDATIRTSKKILRDSLLNIFLSMTHFMTTSSAIRISLTEEHTTIRLKILFEGLGGNIPEMSKLFRVFYSYFDGSDYRINIGLSVALENLRNVGVTVKIARKAIDLIEMDFSIPTTRFLETVQQIHTQEEQRKKSCLGETVLLCIDDVILEMVLTEALADAGFLPARSSLSTLRSIEQSGVSLIADFAFLQKNLVASDELSQISKHMKKLIIVHSKDELPHLPTNANIQSFQKPFEVDTIVSALTQL